MPSWAKKLVLFDIPDIRLFWSPDPRFLNQFQEGQISTFEPFSKYPPCYKDVSFWHDQATFHENHLCQIVRDVAGDMVEQVQLVDSFVHPKTQQASKCYRITFRHMSRNLTNEEVDRMQTAIRTQLASILNVELR